MSTVKDQRDGLAKLLQHSIILMYDLVSELKEAVEAEDREHCQEVAIEEAENFIATYKVKK